MNAQSSAKMRILSSFAFATDVMEQILSKIGETFQTSGSELNISCQISSADIDFFRQISICSHNFKMSFSTPSKSVP